MIVVVSDKLPSRCKVFLREHLNEPYLNLAPDKGLPEGADALILGAGALTPHLTFKARLSDLRGQWWKADENWVMATYHPAALIHGYAPGQAKLFKKDIAKFLLHSHQVGEYCIVCKTQATYYVQKLPFCGEHQPRGVTHWDQVSLFNGI